MHIGGKLESSHHIVLVAFVLPIQDELRLSRPIPQLEIFIAMRIIFPQEKCILSIDKMHFVRYPLKKGE
jgi:hypothetical protein